MADCTPQLSDCVIAGESWFYDITFTETADDGSGNEVQEPVDLTGASIELQWLNSVDDVAVVLDVNITITDAVNGVIQAIMTTADTLALNPEPPAEIPYTQKKYIGDVRVTYQDGTKEVILRLQIDVEPTRNRPA